VTAADEPRVPQSAPLNLRRAAFDLPAVALLLIGTFLLYLPTLRHGFVAYDDDQYVTNNPVVQRGLTWDGVKWAFTTTHFANWLPVTWLSHLLDCSLFGLNAGGHHATSAALHAVNAALVYLVLLSMTGRRGAALAAAALFAAHPLRVESVAWVAERKDVLAGTFFLLTLLAYSAYVRRPTAVKYAALLVFYALGLMSKTMIVTLPFVLLLLDAWPLGRLGTVAWRRLLLEKVPLLVLALVACAWTVVLQKQGKAMDAGAALTPGQRLGNAVVSVPRYLGKIAWPTDLAVFYPHPGSWPAWAIVASAALVAAVTAVAWAARRRAPYLLVGWLWFLGMLVPVSGVLQAGEQAMADRYTYLPGIGLTVAVVWLAAEVAKSRRGTVVGAVIVVLLTLALSGATLAQERHWSSNYALFSHAVASTDDNWLAHGYVGSELAAQGNAAGAEYHFREALRVRPWHADAYYNWGNLLLRNRQLDEAIDRYRNAVRLRPDYAEAHNNLGTALALKGDMAAAEREFALAADARPGYADALYNRGAALAALGRAEEAAAQFEAALRADPANDRARRALLQLRQRT
jgi:tetratricopeptide (TPR) repeat protein